MSLILLKNRTLKPAHIFNAGQQGFWFDFVTPGMWFQVFNGTTPVTDTDQPTGLLLDRSKNLAIGPELVTNGNFDSNINNWTGAGASYTNGEMQLTCGAGGLLVYQAISTTIGKYYYVSSTGRLGTYTDNLQLGFHTAIATPPNPLLFSTQQNQTKAGIFYASASTMYVLLRFPSINVGATAYVDDISVREIAGYHATQTTASARPTSKLSPNRIFLDKTDDRLLITVPTGGFVGTLVLATTEGTAAYGVNIPAGTWALGANTTTGTIYFPGTAIVGAICRHGAMTDSEIARCVAYLRNIGGGPVGYAGATNLQFYFFNASWITSLVTDLDLSATTSLYASFYGCSGLTSFPTLNYTSNITTYRSAWLGCSGLTSFPPLPDTSSVTSDTGFLQSWSGCTSLTTFHANQFDNCPCNNFQNAFINCALTQTSVDNILVSIAAGSVARNTTNGILNMTGGTTATPSAVGQAAADTLRARGWTVTLNGY